MSSEVSNSFSLADSKGNARETEARGLLKIKV